jgi:hypothetical protein
VTTFDPAECARLAYEAVKLRALLAESLERWEAWEIGHGRCLGLYRIAAIRKEAGL